MHRLAALLLAAAFPFQLAHAGFAEDEILLYTFDESTSSTTATEQHASGLDLTLSSGAAIASSTPLDGELGLSWDSSNSLSCDGSTGIASHGADSQFEPSDFTLSAWVYIPNFGSCSGDCTVVSKGNNGLNPSGYWLYVDSVGGLHLDVANGGSTTTISGGTLTAGVWHHVVATLNNKTASLYLDGSIQSLLTMSHYVAYGTEDFVLCGTDSSSDLLNGQLDEFRFWDGALSSSEVQEFYDWYTDSDSDGYNASDDCDMDSADNYPGADEACDGVDNDCDGTVDESDAIDATDFYLDADGDGYGDSTSIQPGCSQPTGYVLDASDCDDSDADTYPGADEYCDTVDNDCDGTVDEPNALDAAIWFTDADGDGYGDSSSTQSSCTQPSGTVADNTDCDDGDSSAYPGADE
ncbi:MAG: LamG-like jellyroll fold domain-containing protein [Myxococcota bacterium]|nr:LamG-like jellyroll fold domain-containing protein [Myxococcota bacterium]